MQIGRDHFSKLDSVTRSLDIRYSLLFYRLHIYRQIHVPTRVLRKRRRRAQCTYSKLKCVLFKAHARAYLLHFIR